ncbi:hypothetical protein IM753_02265 [Moraxella sp. K127]|uniref:hypothetical protein n=1 Tax=Moraxella sp. K127 TaxID=2780079 RepID=UPI00188071DB|nr:hypothetical protein [Moraxella sp. K127]MBE9589815.1 hypothetical protein [Moraxella sp. K127]
MKSWASALSGLILPLLVMTAVVPTAHADTITNVQQAPFVQNAHAIKQALWQGNYHAITPHIHPKKGVRFSMYAHIDPTTDKVFSRSDFHHYLKRSRIKFTWGEQDGKGDLLITTLPDYLTNWVVRDVSLDFDSVAINEFYHGGNSLNNLKQIYHKHDFVEFGFKGSKRWGYLDWRVLRLVFEHHQGRPYLVAIITDEWTI